MTRRKEFSESSSDDMLIAAIRAYIQDHPPPKMAANAMLSAEEFRQLGFTPRELFPVASNSDVAKCEADLGFPLPQLLKRLYLEISNGIAGFSYDILGLQGGCASDSGTLFNTYMSFKTGSESENGAWKTGLLPFCDWGCAIYSCVDCTESTNRILTYEDSGVWAEGHTLSEFFGMWLRGKVSFSHQNVEIVAKETINPFTGKRATISARRPKKPPT